MGSQAKCYYVYSFPFALRSRREVGAKITKQLLQRASDRTTEIKIPLYHVKPKEKEF